MRTPTFLRPAAYLSLALVFAPGCPGDSKPSPSDPSESGDGSSDSSGSGTSEACPGVTDPECVTDAPCGNDEECVLCMCVPIGTGCESIPNAECIADSDCGATEICSDCACAADCEDVTNTCTSDSDCPNGEVCDSDSDGVCGCFPAVCDSEAECQSEMDCGPTQTCEQCVCVDECECDDDTECGDEEMCDGCECVAAGETDPENDCEDDNGATDCNPDIDITGVTIACEGENITVSASFVGMPLNPMPPVLTERQLSMFDDAGEFVGGLFITGGPGPYLNCQVIVAGVGFFPAGPDDRCELSADMNTFDFVLSPESFDMATGTPASLGIYAASQDPMFHFDVFDDLPLPSCP